MKVLIADDDLTACLLLERLIRSRGLQCDFVHDGSAAVLAMQNQEYALAFIDLFMPIENGDEAAARMNCASCKCQVPMMVGILSFEDDGLRKRCITAGMIDVIVKPFCRASVNRFMDLALTSSQTETLSSNKNQESISKSEYQTQTLSSADYLPPTLHLDREHNPSSLFSQPALDEVDLDWALEIVRSMVYLHERRTRKLAGNCPARRKSAAASAAERALRNAVATAAAGAEMPGPDPLGFGELMF